MLSSENQEIFTKFEKPEKVYTFLHTTGFNYSHSTQLEHFYHSVPLLDHQRNNDGWDIDGWGAQDRTILTDKNYAAVTTKLEMCTTYKIELIHVVQEPSFDEVLKFYEESGYLLLGAQGLAYFGSRFIEDLPTEYSIISFDKKENFYKEKNGSYQIPYICKWSHFDKDDSDFCPYIRYCMHTRECKEDTTYNRGDYLLCVKKYDRQFSHD